MKPLATFLLLAGIAAAQCVTPGEICYVQRLDPPMFKRDLVAVATSPPAFEEMMKALRAGDSAGFYQLAVRQYALQVGPRTKIRILESGDGWTEGRIVGGLRDGYHIWIVTAWIGPTEPPKKR